MTWEIHGFGCDVRLVQSLAAALCQQLQAAISSRGTASLAVSGGSTPVGLFQYLSTVDLDWARVMVTLVDERWVDEDSVDSNARLVREHLLQGAASAARFVGLKTAAASPYAATDAVNERLAALAWPLDVVILGMGEDGHTASFFPGAATLPAAMDRHTLARVCAVTPPLARHERLTLTLPVLLAARNLYLHITGHGKWEVLQQAISDGPDSGLPIAEVLYSATQPLNIYYRNGM